MKSILLVEDDQRLSHQILLSLQEAGFIAESVSTPEELEQTILYPRNFDLILLDRLVGHLDTKNKISEIKTRWPEAAILTVSAINTPTERAELINLGSDDYLGKPFLTDEFIARIRSLLRRTPEPKTEVKRIGKSLLDLKNRRISVGVKFETLPAKEFLILSALLSTPGRVISRAEMLESVWGNINHSETNLVEATVTNLRRRLSGLDCGFEIKNQRNSGYWIET